VGKPLVDSPEIDVLSFTGSSKIGKSVALAAAKNLTKVSLELGGKNPLVICDDADLESAVKWTCLSSFSNAGQRCSSASRVIVFTKIYDEFKNRLIEATNTMKLGIEETDDLGPVINKRQMDSILASISKSIGLGATLLAGGTQCDNKKNKNGFFINPAILENLAANDPINDEELFGPVAQLYRVENFEAAMQMANSSQYGLTAAIHTKNIDRAMSFCSAVRAGVVTVNGGTHGSEPHMPFGGVGQSGNGTREPGTEALDIYSDLKNICQIIDPNWV
jgi:aldehyde dehydrogenase (NAD+)